MSIATLYDHSLAPCHVFSASFPSLRLRSPSYNGVIIFSLLPICQCQILSTKGVRYFAKSSVILFKMRNLNIWEVSQRSYDVISEDKFMICYNHNERNCSELYTCSHNLVVTNIATDGEIKWKRDILDVVLEKSKPVNVTYLSLLNTLCVGLEIGEIITVSESGTVCDLAGVCESGLLVSYIFRSVIFVIYV